MIINALLIYGDDFRQRSFWLWLISHISGVLPPHRYRGTVHLLPDSLYFEGYDNILKENAILDIRKEKIEQVYHGYDKIYNVWQTRGMGLNWAPIRLQLSIDQGNEKEFIYIIAGYTVPGTENRRLFSYLINWLG
jgi:hypothetical protein